MRLKTYFASSIEAAMLLALEQMGPEAMIVNSKRTLPQNRHLGEYEVVFASAPEAVTRDVVPEPGAPRLARSSGTDQPDREGIERLNGELSRLAEQIESLGRIVKKTEARHASGKLDAEQAELAHSMAESGFTQEFTLSSILNVPPGSGSLRFRVLQNLVAQVKAAPTLGKTGHGRKVAVLVGPAGVGKSTLIGKLAIRFGVASRRPCQILSLDSDRIGAAEPLRIVAGVLAVGFQLIEEPALLAAALETARDRDLILIDTPGFARDESHLIDRLGAALMSRSEIDVHLVIPASMKPKDMDRLSIFYQPLHPAKVIFTRLDETGQIATALEAAIRWQLPISFLSSGPRIPEDLEIADGSQLARRAFLQAGGGYARRAAA